MVDSKALCGLESPFWLRRDEGIGVDLPMRMVERHSYVGSSILKDQHVLDPGKCESSCVRSTIESAIVPRRSSDRQENEVSWSLLKQMTSHWPKPPSTRSRPL